jgi:hypothetical protein
MNTLVHDHQLHPKYSGAALAGVTFVLLVALNGAASCALAQGTAAQTATTQATTAVDAPRAAAPKTNVATKPATAKSAWKDLTPTQQQALKPLAERWNSLDVERRRKWLVISKNYPNLPPAEQAKLHSRMSDWVSLSIQQRNQARLNFSETKKLSPEEKAEKWQAYQALSPEEKKKLAAKAPSKPAGVAVVKPAPAQKLADVPVTPRTSIPGSKLAAAKHPVDENTLLPQPPAPPTESNPDRANQQ